MADIILPFPGLPGKTLEVAFGPFSPYIQSGVKFGLFLGPIYFFILVSSFYSQLLPYYVRHLKLLSIVE